MSNPYGTQLAAAGINPLEAAIKVALGWSLAPIRRLRELRYTDALDALQEELRLDNITEDDFTAESGNVASVLRLLQCADEGTARRNLRMMAQMIKNQHYVPSDQKDEFQRWAPMLASLSTEEIAVLGTMYRCMAVARAKEPMDHTGHTKKAYEAAKGELVGGARTFGSDAELLDATLSGLRTL